MIKHRDHQELRVPDARHLAPLQLVRGFDSGGMWTVFNIQPVILAAGLGSRLGGAVPKPLTRLSNGETLLERQLRQIDSVLGGVSPVIIVVGFKLDLIVESAPNSVFVYNERYDQTNTSQSLLKALEFSRSDSVLWLNGDVVFDTAVLERMIPAIEADRNAMVVNSAVVGAEEVKYRLNQRGLIEEVSKELQQPRGEAVGINLISATDKPSLIRRLAEVDRSDYFEKGIELAIQQDHLEFLPVEMGDLFAIEIDYPEDLARANEHVEGRV